MCASLARPVCATSSYFLDAPPKSKCRVIMKYRSRDSVVGVVTRLCDGFDSRYGKRFFSSPALWPPVQKMSGSFSSEVKWPGRECDRSPPSLTLVKNEWVLSPLRHMPSWCVQEIISAFMGAEGPQQAKVTRNMTNSQHPVQQNALYFSPDI